MKVNDILSRLAGNEIKWIADAAREAGVCLHVKNLFGSSPSVFIARVLAQSTQHQLIILSDKEEANTVYHDLLAWVDEARMCFFPMSYKKAYEWEEIDNANVLQRTETMQKIHASRESLIIVTYPEALGEKVVQKKTLLSQSFRIHTREKVERNFLWEFLTENHFERSDFVDEPGQFAVRGGITDVFSFSHPLPFRIEFAGDEIESIRTFHPETQLSVQVLESAHITLNVHQLIEQEARQSFMEFIPSNTVIWLKDAELTIEKIKHSFEKTVHERELKKKEGNIPALLSETEKMVDTPDFFISLLEKFSRVEFGHRYYFSATQTIPYATAPQPTFQKNFDLVAKDLAQYQDKQYTLIICTDQAKQADRLQEIFQEINPSLAIQFASLSISEGFIDHTHQYLLYTDHQIFERYHRVRSSDRFSKKKAVTLRELKSLQAGDFVTHIDYGIARFAGMEKKNVNGHEQEVIRLVFKDNDLLFVSIHALHKLSRYSGKDAVPVISKLGSGEWEAKKSKAKKKVKDIAKELIELYAKRKQAPGYAFGADTFLQTELESSFLYEDTPDQAKATDDVKQDMMKPHPMDRLVCGDVGFGKTEIAIRAAFKAVSEGKQVAVLVPTTILAFQHYRTFSNRLSPFPVKLDYISRFKTAKEQAQVAADLKEGKINIVVGTHRLVSADFQFKNLGLLIVDEEQKFGVKVKDRLKEMKVNIDVLTLTATPIPRTLHFSLMGARDLSIIATPPPNRQPVTTEVHTFDEVIIRDAVAHEIKRGGQVFFVHNRIQDIESLANTIYKLVPDARIGLAHGQMDGDKLEKVMLNFMDGETNVLVSTNIIESGLDIPNANTIIINHAHLFGLSDLHQMRGRVGRSNVKAYCYLLVPPMSTLSTDSRKRLQTIEEFSELGDGFKVAMRDLDIRGAGNLLGAEQSGFITDLGFDAYHRILDEAVQELKETDFKELFADDLMKKVKQFVPDCVIETDMEMLIPDSYITQASERFQLYSALDQLKENDELTDFEKNMQDKYGKIPEQVYQLFQIVRLRWLGEKLGMEKIQLKEKKMKVQFLPNDHPFFTAELFQRVFSFIQKNSKRCRLKEGKNLILTIEAVPNVDTALALLNEMYAVEKAAERV